MENKLHKDNVKKMRQELFLINVEQIQKHNPFITNTHARKIMVFCHCFGWVIRKNKKASY